MPIYQTPTLVDLTEGSPIGDCSAGFNESIDCMDGKAE
jgi:hypothetical protein